MRRKNQNQMDEGVPKATQQPPDGQAGLGGREARARFPDKAASANGTRNTHMATAEPGRHTAQPHSQTKS